MLCASSLPSAPIENLGKPSQLSIERLHILQRGPFTFLTPLTVAVFALTAFTDELGNLEGRRALLILCGFAGAVSRHLPAAGSSEIQHPFFPFTFAYRAVNVKAFQVPPQTKRVSKSANVAPHTLMWCMLSYCTSFTSLSHGSVRNRARRGAEMP